MNKEQFIKSKFREILSETIDERSRDIEQDLYDVVPFHAADGSSDYVEEGDDRVCEQCGGSEVREGECKECGWKGGQVMETKRRSSSKNSDSDIDDLIKDLRYDLQHDDDEEEEDEVEFELEIDEEEHCEQCGRKPMEEKLYGGQKKLDKNRNGRLDREDFKMLRKQQDEEQLYEIEFTKTETDEGNAFTGALAKAKGGNEDTFEVDGKEYPVKESYLVEKWKGDVKIKQTGEYSDMSIEELNAAIKKQKAKNDKTQESGKKVSHADKTKMSQLYFAKRAKQNWKGKGKAKVTESILYTESDLIDLIENLVKEEKKKFKMSEPNGYKEYERAHKADKKENEDYLKMVAKKMTDYLKPSSDKFSKYEMKETKKFPTENGGLEAKRKKYTPSEAVDDYIDAFSYPGQTNLVFDEIKPTDKNIEKYLKGHRTTGNAQVDDDGNALGNVVPSKVGDKFYKNYQDNLYGQEQMDASYKRQPQPVDQAGEETERGSLKTKRGKKTSQSVLNKLEESLDLKTQMLVTEEFQRIQQLMGYDRKTQ